MQIASRPGVLPHAPTLMGGGSAGSEVRVFGPDRQLLLKQAAVTIPAAVITVASFLGGLLYFALVAHEFVPELMFFLGIFIFMAPTLMFVCEAAALCAALRRGGYVTLDTDGIAITTSSGTRQLEWREVAVLSEPRMGPAILMLRTCDNELININASGYTSNDLQELIRQIHTSAGLLPLANADWGSDTAIRPGLRVGKNRMVESKKAVPVPLSAMRRHLPISATSDVKLANAEMLNAKGQIPTGREWRLNPALTRNIAFKWWGRAILYSNLAGLIQVAVVGGHHLPAVAILIVSPLTMVGMGIFFHADSTESYLSTDDEGISFVKPSSRRRVLWSEINGVIRNKKDLAILTTETVRPWLLGYTESDKDELFRLLVDKGGLLPDPDRPGHFVRYLPLESGIQAHALPPGNLAITRNQPE